MRRLGTASTDLTKGIASLSIILLIIAGAARFSVSGRILFGLSFAVVFALWYFERYAFYDDRISIFRPSKLRAPVTVALASSISSIRFYEHLNMSTGTYVYIHFVANGKPDLVAFNFRRRHLFLLEFVVMNGITVDTGGIAWIESARLNALAASSSGHSVAR